MSDSSAHLLTALPRVVPAPVESRPQRPGAREHQHEVSGLADGSRSWTSADARSVAARYDGLAADWEHDRGSYRPVPLEDALRRGGPWPAGVCLEVGAGTGLLTPLLEIVWPLVVSIDVSAGMSSRSPSRRRAIADAARLPVPDDAVAAVVLADAPLFAGEVARVLRADGVLVWSNALGSDAPYHVPAGDVVTALRRASRQDWTAVTSEAGWGSWLVSRR